MVLESLQSKVQVKHFNGYSEMLYRSSRYHPPYYSFECESTYSPAKLEKPTFFFTPWGERGERPTGEGSRSGGRLISRRRALRSVNKVNKRWAESLYC